MLVKICTAFVPFLIYLEVFVTVDHHNAHFALETKKLFWHMRKSHESIESHLIKRRQNTNTSNNCSDKPEINSGIGYHKILA